MSNMDLTVILDDLAAGRIDAAEAKRRIDAVGTDDADESEVSAEWSEVSTEWPTAAGEAEPGEPIPGEDAEDESAPEFTLPPKTENIKGISKVFVKATGRKVRITADSAVTTVAAEDVHQVRRHGSTMEIIGDKEFSGVVDAISWAKSVRGLDDVKALGIGQELTIRVNPALEVDIDLTGCSLQVTDIPRIGKVRLTAGIATITGARMVCDLLLQAGQATVTGCFTQGWSRIRCESGQAVLEVSRDSDVVVRADAQLGRVSWESCDAPEGQIQLGNGTAHVDLGVVLGHGVVRVV